MRSSLLLATAALTLLVMAAVSFGWQQGARAQTTAIIEIGDFWFCDSSFENGVCEREINVGDTVEWQWVGATGRYAAGHTTTECAGDLDACSEPHLWDSPVQKSGTFSFTFSSPGTFLYRCQVHPTVMRGQITVNAPPVAGDDSATVQQDSRDNAIDVLANDSDPDVNDTLTVTAVTQPAKGTTAAGTGGANVLYTPDAGFSGKDTFTYTISDGHGGMDTATVTVTVAKALGVEQEPTPTPTSTPTPTPTLTPAVLPAAVPNGGSAPPPGGSGAPASWWLALVAGGGLLLSGATALAVLRARRA